MIIKANHQIDLLKKRRKDSKSSRLTFSKIKLLRKRGLIYGLVISGVGLSICLWTSFQTFTRIKYKERLIIEANEYQLLKTKYNKVITNLKSIYNINNQIAQGIIGTKSGSALLLELREKLPSTIQLISIKSNGNDLILQGKALQPSALSSINLLKIKLSKSFLIKNKSVFLSRAKESQNEKESQLIFTLNSKFTTPKADELIVNYERLGSLGLLNRVNLLKQEGLIK